MLPDVIRPSVRNTAYDQLREVQSAMGMDNLLPEVMEGSFAARLTKVHDAVARSGDMPVVDSTSVIDPGGFQMDLNEVRCRRASAARARSPALHPLAQERALR